MSGRARVEFVGNIQTADGSVVRSILESWLGSDQVRHKVRLLGEELVYEDDDIYAYAYTAGPDDGHRWYLIEGHTTHQLDAAITRIEALLAACTNAGVDADFDVQEVDERGDSVGDEHHIR